MMDRKLSWREQFLKVIPLGEFFHLDTRSLAVFRVGLAVLLLLDWSDRLVDVRTFYSDDGVLPRVIVPYSQPFSVFLWSGSPWVTAALMGVGIVAALMMLVGWKTPFATAVSWFLAIGIHARHPALLQGGEHLMRMLLFWGIFLPLGAVWSVDAADPKDKRKSYRIVSLASIALIIQLCLVYWYAAAWKWDPEWREEGNAVYLALHIDHFPSRIGLWVRDQVELCQFMTHATIWLETVGPVLFFLPFAPALQRMILVVVFILFHIGLAMTMELGNFPFICCVAWLPVLPTAFWDRVNAVFRSKQREGTTIRFDPERPKVQFRTAMLRTFLLLEECPWEAAKDHRGWSVSVEGRTLHGRQALAALVALSPVFYPFAGWFNSGLGDWVTAWITAPGTVTPRTEPARPGWEPPSGLITQAVLVVCLGYVVLWNIRTFLDVRGMTYEELRSGVPVRTGRYYDIFPDQNSAFGNALGLEQGWGLFAPRPGKDHGWYVVIARLKNGQTWDIYHDCPVDESKPEFLAATYYNARWRKFSQSFPALDAFKYCSQGFIRWLALEWNRSHAGGEKVLHVELIYWREETRPPGEKPPPPERIVLMTFTPDGTK